MRTRRELIELAELCADQARLAQNEDVARELWRMAREFQQKAAQLDGSKLANIDPLSHWLN
jgi:hypothetical protein